MPEPEEILRSYWGYERFRPPQAEIIADVLAGKDCLALLPTGGGKSLCYQVPALVLPGICLVVSPLIALMEDQVQQLRTRNISCALIHSGMSAREVDVILDNCVYGSIRMLYCSPERLQTAIFRERVARMKLSLIAVDEAHCISEWGHDFRPAYRKIAAVREIHPKVPMLALTASATPQVQQDIAERLGLRQPVIRKKSFLKPNLSFVVRDVAGKDEQVVRILTRTSGSSIVYVRSRKATEEWAARLTRKGLPALAYHAGLTHQERQARQTAWITGKTRIMAATNAFGMGIDKPDVRSVIHIGLPDSLESYYQEAGRGGRDGAKAYAVLLADQADAADLLSRTASGLPDAIQLRHLYQCLANYFQLAEGAGEGVGFPFDPDAFGLRYRLKPAQVRAGLRRLCEFGFIEFHDRYFQPSRVHIFPDRNELYAFQVAHERFDPLIQALLRMYGAELFSGFVSVSEGSLAAALATSPKNVTEDLHALSRLRIIHYTETSSLPRLVWMTPRQDATRLMIDNRKLEEWNKRIRDRAQAMSEYASQSAICRQLIMLRYFGETAPAPCGCCDICRATASEPKDLRGQIVDALAGRSLTPVELEKLLQPESTQDLSAAIRELVEDGTIGYDSDWKLFLQNK